MRLVSKPTRNLACDANDLYFLCSLGNLSAASFLAHDGRACAARPGLVAEKGEPPRTPSIYATHTWSGRVGEAKYKRCDANNKRGCKVRNAKWECDCNCECRCGLDAFLYLSPTFLLSSSSSFPISVSLSQLGASETRPAMSEWQLSLASSETRPATSDWQLSSALASFSSLPDYPSVKPTSQDVCPDKAAGTQTTSPRIIG